VLGPASLGFQILAGGFAGEGFHAAHACADRAFPDNLEQGDIARAIHMDAAAKFDRIGFGSPPSSASPMASTRTVSPYFSPNKRQRAGLDGGLRRHLRRFSQPHSDG
jgi:hypothetical protein